MWYVIAFLLGLISLYVLFFGIFCIYGICRGIYEFPKSNIYTQFAIIIPARNEQDVIANTIHSLQVQNYPKEKYQIYIAVNNSSDQTEEIAKQLGAIVISPRCKTSTKGQVLKDVFLQLQSHNEIDSYVIFDADNVVDQNFLTEINHAMKDGAVVCQGRRICKSIRPNVLQSCYEVFYIFQNIFFNHARFITNHSGSLNGTGWAIRKDWIDQHGFHPKTITEDLESIAWFSITRTKVKYVHHAITYDEYPSSLPIAFKQLQRWIFGQLQCGRYYTKPLLKQLIKHHNTKVIDPLLVFNMTVFVELLLGILICSIVMKTQIIVFTMKCLCIAYIVLCIGGFIGTVKCRYPISKYWLGIVFFPLFITLWIPILFTVQFKKDLVWSPIDHHDQTSIEDHQ